MQHSVIRLMVLFCVTTLFAGCGGGGPSDAPELAPVTGKVTIDGKAAENVMVVFKPEKGRPAIAMTDSEGMYEIRYLGEEGAIIGKNQVTISTPEPDGSESDGCGGTANEEISFIDPIPPKYNSEANANSEMTVEVKAGEENAFNFDIKSDPGASRRAAQGQSSRQDTCS